MTDDNKLYINSLEYVKRCFDSDYNRSDDVLVLSISRKGPKLLEKIFAQEPRESLNTITEVALPFCMRRLSKITKDLTVKIFDDAIYFGTTVENVYSELKAFEQLYGIHSKKKLYTAIRAKEAKSNLVNRLDGIEVHSYNDDNEEVEIRDGYGHFFIRQFERDISVCNNTLEIEFPIVEFDCDVVVDKEKLFKSLCEQYGERNVYIAKHYENESISVLLDDKPGQSFRKFRVYVNERAIRVVCMSPWLLPNDMAVLFGMFRWTPWEQLWDRLASAYYNLVIEERGFNVHAFLQVERSIKKSLVIMANYILSFDLLRTEQEKLMRAFNSCMGEGVAYKGVRKADLFYLLGDVSLCDEVIECINRAWNGFGKQTEVFDNFPNMSPLSLNIDYQVFENADFLGAEELCSFQNRNVKMLSNCRNEDEALSALFFNQTAMIEKWSRRDEKYSFGRLRFGYTFGSLFKDLQATFSNEDLQNIHYKTHQWLDHRIDQACVVPQYVVDHVTNTWCRVFRPGENEDALLNHMARLVLMVYKRINDQLNLGWVGETLLKEMLCLMMTNENKEEINDSFDFTLSADYANRTLFFQIDGENEWREVYEYMRGMDILTENNHVVTIGKELGDDEISKVTTLNQKLSNSIAQRVSMIAGEVKSYCNLNDPSFVTNFYFFKKNDLSEMQKLNDNTISALNQIVAYIENQESVDEWKQVLINNYTSLRRYIVSTRLFSNWDKLQLLRLNQFDQTEYVKDLIIMWRAKIAFELIIAAYMQNNATMLESHADLNPENYMTYGEYYGLDKDSQVRLDAAVGRTKDMNILRSEILVLIKHYLKNITNVNLKFDEYDKQDSTPTA